MLLRAGNAVYRTIVVRGRWLMVLVWIALTFLAVTRIPAQASGSSFGTLLPADSPIVQDQNRILKEFAVPVQSGTTVVLHDPHGLSDEARAASYRKAVDTTKQQGGAANLSAPPGTLIGAVPLPTTSRDVTVTYLYTSNGTQPRDAIAAAHTYADGLRTAPTQETFVTGFTPAQLAQSNYLARYIHFFELISLVLIVVVVALAFRSLLAPIMVLGMAAVAYVIHQRLLPLVAARSGISVPDELQPVLMALLLGVVTDYCVLMLEAFREHLKQGLDKRKAASEALRLQAPIITVAALAVACGTLALAVSPLQLFRPLGPAMAFTVLMGALVSLTLAPGVMCILGWLLFAPLPLPRFRRELRGEGEAQTSAQSGWVITLLTKRFPAFLTAVIMLGLLVAASLPLRHAQIDLSFTSGLPRTDEVARGSAALDAAGIAGATSPTEVLIEQPDVKDHLGELAALQKRIAATPGVAGVLGPAELADNGVQNDNYAVVISKDGNAARFVVVLNSEPSGSRAIQTVRTLRSQLPDDVRAAGLQPSYATVTGQSVIAAEVSQQTVRAMIVTMLVALAAELVLLVVYLRSLLGPIVLVGVSLLTVTAALGLTVYVFQGLQHREGLTFYAPFASAVLLLALGADYSVFIVGAIWTEARGKPMPDAIRAAVPKVARAITIAGAILAATFAAVAVIPLSTFWQIAFTMAVGLLIDTYLVRPLLTPSLLTLLGRAGTWPRHRKVPQSVGAAAAPDPGE